MKHRSTARAGAARRWAARSMLGATLLSLLLPGVVGAAGNGAVAIHGVQMHAGSCGGDGYLMTVDLDGCWWITAFNPQTADETKHNLRATGRELFVGWIGDRYGSFETDFQYTAKFDGQWSDFIEIHGRCHHPIDPTSGTGDFVGISGEISFKDVVDVDPPYYPYWGNVRIAGETLTLNAAPLRSTTSTGTSAALSC